MSHKLPSRDKMVSELQTIRDFIRFAVSEFNRAEIWFGHGSESSWDEAVNLVLSSLNLPPDSDSAVLDARLLQAERERIAERLVLRIKERKPVAYLVNEAWFAGLAFYVDERVIIPRSPIAELIEEGFSPWLEEGQITNVLDLCTGSGCCAIATAMHIPETKVDAVDISPDALDVARKNIDRFDCEDQVEAIESDLFAALTGRKYDIIVSNPPYVSEAEYNTLPDEYHHEPTLALTAPEDGMEIVRRILKDAAEYLEPHGILIVEVGHIGQEQIEELYPNIPFTWLQFERGGEGVFLLTRQELVDAAAHL